MRRMSFLLLATLAAALACSEIGTWRASRRGPFEGDPTLPRAVVVLGYGNRGVRANAVNRYRVRVGLRTRHGLGDVMVFSGGAVRGAVPEAVLMRDYATGRRRYRGRTLVEKESRSTHENVRNVIPLIEDAEAIAFASHAPHAEKARAELRRLRPDLAERLVRADDYRLGEIPVVKGVVLVRLSLVRLRERWAPRRGDGGRARAARRGE